MRLPTFTVSALANGLNARLKNGIEFAVIEYEPNLLVNIGLGRNLIDASTTAKTDFHSSNRFSDLGISIDLGVFDWAFSLKILSSHRQLMIGLYDIGRSVVYEFTTAFIAIEEYLALFERT